ncbi:MerR family transcriptional regulator [Methylocystis heyeri]|uniref:MerR family transcriptional regulator n=1 Tax=Methylocystis heyeri TaxID=391905 RepID=A0A6B8KFC9_9HYPH|nr:MerR family transcriptional regulator [Methylocystis heyeri]QGM45761.1 MerR family transcriptional regulator [Methylocystis heyeri]
MSEQKEQGFRTIGEVAESLDLPPHVLRFWETRFKELEPLKRAGGRRYYRPRDVELVMALRHLLYGQGYTIKGVQRILKEQGARAVIESLREGRFQPGASGLEARGEDRPEAPPPEPMEKLMEPQFEPAATEIAAVPRREPEPEPEPEPFHSAPPPPPPPVRLPAVAGPLMEHAPQLGEDDIRQLRLALADLAECRRLLLLAKR